MRPEGYLSNILSAFFVQRVTKIFAIIDRFLEMITEKSEGRLWGSSTSIKT